MRDLHSVSLPAQAHKRLAGASAAVIVLLLIGAVIGRALASSNAAPKSQPRPSSTIAPSSGPRENDGGVPVGYTRTEAGAASAATNYLLTTVERLVPLDSGARRAAVQRMLAPDAGPGVTDDILAPLALIDAARQAAHVASGRALIRLLPMAYRIDAFSPDRARVGVWSSGVFSIEGLTAPTEAWSTTTIDLEWAHGDWRLYAVTGRPGPVPAAPEAPVTTAADLLGALDGFSGYRYEPIR